MNEQCEEKIQNTVKKSAQMIRVSCHGNKTAMLLILQMQDAHKHSSIYKANQPELTSTAMTET